MLGKGTGNGQQIRDYILVIMHKFNLPRKGKYFYEQWHQKLHNNTTPDDITICEALLSFLKSNNIKNYWKVLNDNGIDKKRLESYERNITPWREFLRSVPLLVPPQGRNEHGLCEST